MAVKLHLAGLSIDIERKPIKNLHLGVYPPDGRVRIAAPEGMSMDGVRLFAIGKLPWIRRQRQRLMAQPREPAREYLERESHYVWGRRYLLSVIEEDAPPSVVLRPRKLQLTVRPGTSLERRRDLIDEWYRNALRAVVGPLLAKWEPILGVRVKRVFVQRMKTKWGSCNASARHIRLNSELAKKPVEFLEYVLVHEIAHFRCSSHGLRFIALMDEVMPSWRDLREGLNQLPLGSYAPPK